MADKKISELPVITGSQLADGDLLTAVDVSETDPTVANKKVTISELESKFNRGFAQYSSATTASLSDEVIVCNTSSAAFALTLPTAIGNTGKRFTVTKANSELNKLTITPQGGEFFDGFASQFLLGFGESVTFVSDGSNWLVLSWDAGFPIDFTQDLDQENNIAVNSASARFEREYLIYETMHIRWDGLSGTGVSIFGQLPGGLTIDSTRLPEGTSITTPGAANFGSALVFFGGVGWADYWIVYGGSNQWLITGGPGNLQYSQIDNGDSIRFPPALIKIPIA